MLKLFSYIPKQYKSLFASTQNIYDYSLARLFSAQVPIHARSLDRIHIRGSKFFGFHGALPEENTLGQVFEVDTTVGCSLEEAGKNDDLTKTINYAEIHKIVERVITGPPHQLVESVAETICSQVLQHHLRVQMVQVHVKKHCIPGVPAVVQSVGVEITRMRKHDGR
ncbi:hypothetical protein CEUSTIGMA_g6334.t1 [Chlamydomonas eustigma]|uniref:7,8-dihydroneopterin aldolase n=1 Tax=Chlamydomonas eustigma TaxID=1157962 RepID=A0A250X754_9CHLO|nr:hypothetical protein CEUSTIGMA_g6334.t1 [Chlamydomonas eustigma]|eukprot:GAX78895.1 hypothetical protein CEUSTIGMA_g6334.t1 [Chlamydomonas eustigma]